MPASFFYAFLWRSVIVQTMVSNVFTVENSRLINARFGPYFVYPGYLLIACRPM